MTPNPPPAAVAPPDLDGLFTEHRRELHVHCYRMLASFEDAEDAVQETFVRAWRAAGSLDDRGHLRAWLYRIATNVCLDALRARRRRPQRAGSFAELPWLEPYPDHLLDEAAEARPDARAVARETIGLSFLAALQALPPRQRAVLIARDVHHWSARETAELLGTTVAAANSALQRARAEMRRHRPAPSAREASSEERALLDRFIDSYERGDAALAVELAARDIRVTMPPAPMCFDGLDQVRGLIERALGRERDGDWRLLPTSVNRMPAAGCYLRRPGDARFRAFKLDVLRVAGGAIAEITTFGVSHLLRTGLPAVLPPPPG